MDASSYERQTQHRSKWHNKYFALIKFWLHAHSRIQQNLSRARCRASALTNPGLLGDSSITEQKDARWDLVYRPELLYHSHILKGTPCAFHSRNVCQLYPMVHQVGQLCCSGS